MSSDRAWAHETQMQVVRRSWAFIHYRLQCS